MCNSHFLNYYYKVNPIGQWEQILITIMGFAHAFGQYFEPDGILINETTTFEKRTKQL